MIRIRIRRCSGGGYRIDEQVTADGLYITWNGYYATYDGALACVNSTLKGCKYTLASDGVAFTVRDVI